MDGQIKFWNNKIENTQTISLEKSLEEIGTFSLRPRIRSIDENIDGNLLIGTRGGEIIEFTQKDDDGKLEPKILLSGHWDKEVWGLCIHPTEPTYYSAGEDYLVAAWNTETKEMINKTPDELIIHSYPEKY